MQHDPIVTIAKRTRMALRELRAAEARQDWREVGRLVHLHKNLVTAERETVPRSAAGAAQKLRNIAAGAQVEPGASNNRFARSAIRTAGKIERGNVTPLVFRMLRALMTAALRHDLEANGATTVHALAHVYAWCARRFAYHNELGPVVAMTAREDV